MGFVLRSSKSDDHNTAHGHVLSRVFSRLIRISVFPCFLGVLTSSLNNKSVQRDSTVRNSLYGRGTSWNGSRVVSR
jgi:hypothetical protein